MTTPPPVAGSGNDRTTGRPEFIDRLAEQLRATGGVDLPHAYFVAQVKSQLAGRDLNDDEAVADLERAVRSSIARTSRSVFQAWAMPDAPNG